MKALCTFPARRAHWASEHSSRLAPATARKGSTREIERLKHADTESFTTREDPIASSSGSEVLNEERGAGAARAILLLNISALLFGTNQVVIKVTEGTLSPLALDCLRFGTAALCFSGWWPRTLKNADVLMPSLELGFWLTVGYTAQAYGLQHTSAAHGAFMCTCTVLAIPVLVGLSGRKVAARTWYCALAGLAGVSLLTTSSGSANWGDFWCFASAVMFGVHTWRSECITVTLPDATIELVSGQLLVLGIAATVLAGPEILNVYHSLGAQGMLDRAPDLPWPAILFLGVGTTAASSWIELDALKEVSSPVAALTYTLEPLYGASLSWALLGERWGAQGWVGAGLIIAASLYSQIGKSGATELLPIAQRGDEDAP